ncbi:hypothetical protein HD554DRAFT_61970 [Boletus coccyginus]|nr:hypothetical protein HD554DRAFT_61970 [Boletus coccyginus]
MLKVWKDSSRQSHSISWQDGQPGNVGVDDPTALLETSSVGLTPELDLNTVPLKRTRQSSNQDSDTHSVRSSKRARTSAPHSAHQKHSPGAFACADELLEFAKTRNTIVIYSHSDDVTDLSSKFLMWAAESLAASFNRASSSSLRQLSVVVVPDDAHIDGLATKIATKSLLRVAACHGHEDTPDLSVIQVVVCSVDANIAQSPGWGDLDNFAPCRFCSGRGSFDFTGGIAVD